MALRRPSLVRAVVALLIGVLAFAPVAYAVPSTPQIAAKQAEVTKAQQALDDMRTDLEMKVEEYNKVDAALADTRRRIDETRARLEVEDQNLRQAQQLLDTRASAIYQGGDGDVLEVVLGTSSFEDFLTRLDLLARVAANDAALVTQVKDARERVAQMKLNLEQREAEQVALRTQAEDKKQQVEAQIAKQKDFVDSLNGQVATLIKQEEQRIAAEAAARAKALAAAEAAAKAGQGVITRVGNASGGHPEAVGIAMKYIGVPYVWGGTSPSGFDCSGLCQYVYKQLGISIPRVAQDQFYAGKRIPADRLDLLKPGDLLFFGRGKDPDQVHHVVMYAGGDDIIEAPYTGADVRVASLKVRLSHNEYVGASRY